MASVAGYWALANLGPNFISYYGCDLVFTPGKGGQTHFYGKGDEGPLVGNFQYNLRPYERSIRFLCWALMHNVVVTNSSAEDGTKLCYPHLPLHTETQKLYIDIIARKETQRLVRKAGNVFAFEMQSKTESFYRTQRHFEEDESATQAMNTIMDVWLELEPFVNDYKAHVEELVAASQELTRSNLVQTPNVQLQRIQNPSHYVLHLGFHKTASTYIQNTLESQENTLKKYNVRVIPHKKLRKNYTQLVEVYANQTIGMDYGDPIDVEIFREFSKSFFDDLKIKPGSRVILSEENAAGHVGQCAFPGLLYRFPKQYLSTFASSLPSEAKEVHVLVRDYASFFTSCYIEYLGSVRASRFISPEIMMAKVMTNLPSWKTLMDMVRLSFTRADIHVWKFEDFDHLKSDFFQAMTGTPEGTLDLDLKPKINARRSPGQADLEALQQNIMRNGLDRALDDWRELRQNMSPRRSDFVPYDPWTPSHKAHLWDLYERDLDEIAQDVRFTVHRAETSSPLKKVVNQ